MTITMQPHNAASFVRCNSLKVTDLSRLDENDDIFLRDSTLRIGLRKIAVTTTKTMVSRIIRRSNVTAMFIKAASGTKMYKIAMKGVVHNARPSHL